jgi:hypothetical protein
MSSKDTKRGSKYESKRKMLERNIQMKKETIGYEIS